jgi:FkbM family methyltransferase
MTAFISYAQNAEDVLINRCFGHRDYGFYIDVGASHPVKDSPTYASYCRGWSGVNVEPIAERAAELRRLRPRDITIQAVAGASAGEMTLYRTDGIGGLSSCISDAMKALRQAGSAIDQLTVPMLTLDGLCADYGIADVQVLKIDVEGYEESVLAGFSFTVCRPELIIIEAVSPASEAGTVSWIDRLSTVGYAEAYDDAVNLFFIRQESDDLRVHFRKPVSVLDNVCQFNAQGSCLIRPDHPDHRWSVNLAATILRHTARLSDQDTLAILTSDIAASALTATVDLDGINRAFYLVLGRWVTSEEAPALLERAGRDGLPLKSLIFELLNSPEYLDRMGRVAASV